MRKNGNGRASDRGDDSWELLPLSTGRQLGKLKRPKESNKIDSNRILSKYNNNQNGKCQKRGKCLKAAKEKINLKYEWNNIKIITDVP